MDIKVTGTDILGRSMLPVTLQPDDKVEVKGGIVAVAIGGKIIEHQMIAMIYHKGTEVRVEISHHVEVTTVDHCQTTG
jgi:hypothetical protein